ncbi:MAG: hypothetical protein ACFFBD_12090 [Candidatus Hodarchaeota archaeon]
MSYEYVNAQDTKIRVSEFTTFMDSYLQRWGIKGDAIEVSDLWSDLGVIFDVPGDILHGHTLPPIFHPERFFAFYRRDFIDEKLRLIKALCFGAFHSVPISTFHQFFDELEVEEPVPPITPKRGLLGGILGFFHVFEKKTDLNECLSAFLKLINGAWEEKKQKYQLREGRIQDLQLIGFQFSVSPADRLLMRSLRDNEGQIGASLLSFFVPHPALQKIQVEDYLIQASRRFLDQE